MTDEYARLLAARLVRLRRIGAGLRSLPMEDQHELTGLPVYVILCACAHAYVSTEAELIAVKG